MKTGILIAAPLLLFSSVRCLAEDRPNVVPANGYIPDERTAIAVGLAVLEPVYGHEILEREKPFHAILINGVWKVEGTLKRPHRGGFALGGTAVIELDQRTGRIIRMIHEK